MTTRFTGRTAVVTGGVSGIGEGIARRLAPEGARVSLWDRDAGALAKSEAPHKVTLDVTDPAAVQRAAEATAAALGKIDILVTSAGITGPNHPTWDYPVAAWDRVIDVNLKGVFYCNRAVVPFMQTQRLRPHRQHRLDRRQGGQSECLGLFRIESRRDRVDQVARQGTRQHRNPRQLRHARGGEDADFRPDDAAADRLDAVENPHRPVRRDR